ncbi:MAG: hypothetical protein Fur005_34560 [Roseiflexaceae bacterium]
MSDFTLLDLDAQLDEVVNAIGSHNPEYILDWLRQRGSVHKIVHPLDQNLYGFESTIGIRTAFRFTVTGDLVIISRHATRSASDKE